MTITIRYLILYLSLLIPNLSHATVPVMRYPSGTPVNVCVPSDTNTNCGGGTGTGTGGSFIKTDGTSTTTAVIPFAQGISATQTPDLDTNATVLEVDTPNGGTVFGIRMQGQCSDCMRFDTSLGTTDPSISNLFTVQDGSGWSPTSTAKSAWSIGASPILYGPNNADAFYGFLSTPSTRSSPPGAVYSGTATQVSEYEAQGFWASGTVTNLDLFHGKILTTAGTVTNLTGLRLEDITGGGTTRAIKTGLGIVQFGDDLIFGNDNTDDIGASGATRPRTGYFGTSVITPLLTATNIGAATFTGDLTLSTHNLITDTTTGSKIFTAANQKGSFWGASTIVQPANTTNIDDVLVNTGLRASGGTAGFSTTIKPRTGGTAAGSEPMQFTSAALLTTATVGTFEFLTDKPFFTITTGAARKELALNDQAGSTTRVVFRTTNGRLTDINGFSFASSNLTVPNIIVTNIASGASDNQIIYNDINTNKLSSSPTVVVDTSNNLALTNSLINVASSGGTTEGQVWNDSTQKSRAVYQSGIKQMLEGVLFTQTADKTVTNTAAETSIIGTGVGTITLPANFFLAGKTIRISGGGIYSAAIVPGNLTIKVKYGTIVLASVVITNLAGSGSNLAFQYSTTISCRTTGATGTVITDGNASYETAVLARGFAALNNGAATATIDTTASNALDVTATWATMSASNILKTVDVRVEVLN